MIFENCDNITLKIHSMVIGLEFSNCKNIKIIIKEYINSIESYKSTIQCMVNKENKIIFFSEKSKIIIKNI